MDRQSSSAGERFPSSFSPFASPRKKPTKEFRKFAIILMEEQNNDPVPKPREPPSFPSRVGPLAAELLSSSKLPQPPEDVMAHVVSILKSRIKAHSGIEAAVLTTQEVIEKNNRALVPLMYRIATEDFVKSCPNPFKVIESRNITKLSSNWKPTVPDLLIAREHQVIIVHLQKSFLPYNDFVYAVLRQLNHNWKLRLPRKAFYPNDVCKVEGTHDRDLIVIFPAVLDGDLEISRKMSSLNYELITMFKRSCHFAMTNYLLMRDMRVGNVEDTMDALESIRTLYQNFQTRLREGGQFRLKSGRVDKARFASPATFTSKPVVAYEDKEFDLTLDDDFDYEVPAGCVGDIGKVLEDLARLPDKKNDYNTKGKEQSGRSMRPHSVHAGGDGGSRNIPNEEDFHKNPYEWFWNEFKRRNLLSSVDTSANFHERLSADLDRIQKIIQQGRSGTSAEIEDTSQETEETESIHSTEEAEAEDESLYNSS